MISPDLIFRFLLGILEPNHFGWALIIKPEFIEYAKKLSFWITNPDKDQALLEKQYYVPVGIIISHEITRRSLIASSKDVYTIPTNLFDQFFSANTILDYILVYDHFLDVVTDDIVEFRQKLRFILTNTSTEIETQERSKLKNLLTNREANYNGLRGKKYFITDRVVVMLDFHDREELQEWLKIRNIKYKQRKFDIYFF